VTLLAEPETTPSAPARGGKGSSRVSLLLSVLVIGALLRLLLYVVRPGLHLDEARVALNVAGRSWLELIQPLDYDQTAPLLFLWATKLFTVLGVVNELTLRALPFLASVALLPLVYLTARRLAGESVALLAAALTAVSPMLLLYSRQVKPYTVDALVAAALLWLALDWLDRPDDPEPARRMAAAVPVAVWASTPAVFVVAGVLGVLWFGSPTGRPSRYRLAGVAALSALAFLPAYWLIYRPGADNPYMQLFWRESLLAVGVPGFFGRAWQGTRELFWQTFVGGTTEPPVAEGLANLLVLIATLALVGISAVGARLIARQSGPARLALLVAPLLVGYAASLAGKYPVAGRVMAFTAPMMIIALAAGGAHIIETAHGSRRRSTALVYGSLLGLALPLGVMPTLGPSGFGGMRAAVRDYQRRSDGDEPVYVFAAALPAWTFYTTDWTAPDQTRLRRMARLGRSDGAVFENAAPRVRPVAPNEGDSLAYPFRESRELLGLPHGAQWRSGSGMLQHFPDTNWTEVEAQRIRQSAAPAVWFIATQTYGVERPLFREIGLCSERWRFGRTVLLARLLPREPGVGGCGQLHLPTDTLDVPPEPLSHSRDFR
jgi:4-amino-4-deoxy-L-arabinose transferase-like glycosyltransferase